MSRRQGFTLVELMVALAIVVAAVGAAAPGFGLLIRSQRLRAASGELYGAIGLARAQALARGQVVLLRPADRAGRDWTAGWTVFVDGDGDGVRGPGDELLAVHGPLARGIAAGFAFTNSTPPYYIAYNGAGRSCGDRNPAAAHWGTLELRDGRLVRRITINMLGRARLCDPARDTSCGGDG